MIVRGTDGAGVGVCVAVDVVDFGVGAVSNTFEAGGGTELVEFVVRVSFCAVSFLGVDPVVNCLRLLEGACSVTMICSPLVIGTSDSLAFGLPVTVGGNAFGGYPNLTEQERRVRVIFRFYCKSCTCAPACPMESPSMRRS